VKKRPLAWAAVVVALVELSAALWLLSDTWKGSPVAAPFTRVGGATRVETAVEASRFWLKPPRFIVVVRPGASKARMLDAARCAMVKDAPLLFTSRDPKRNRLVTATIDAWHEVSAESAKHQSGEDLAGRPISRAPGSGKTLILRWNGRAWQPGRIQGCVPGGQSDISGVSTLAVPRRLLRLHRIVVSGTLDPVVVFAAAWSAKDPADVAVGMALGAHLERAKDKRVSLVVVPRYLQADPGLENQLLSQRELVNGVVLGSTSVLPEDTRTLLRLLLRSADQQGALAQLENTFGTAGILVTALAGLIPLAVAAAAAPVLIRELAGIEQVVKTEPEENGDGPVARNKQTDLLAGLGKEPEGAPAEEAQKPPAPEAREPLVTIWLRSGGTVTGTMKYPDPGTVGTVTALRLDDVTLMLSPDGSDQEHAVYLLVPVDDIKLIGVDVQSITGGQ
jgi:hypothetical protein